MTRALLSLATALLLLAAAPVSVPHVGAAPLASDQWCEDDPPVVIVTPEGARVLVHVTDGALGIKHLAAIQAARVSYSVVPIDDNQTLVHMTVWIANDAFGSQFPTRSTVSSGPFATGTVYAQASGVSGAPLHMIFRLDVA